MHLSKFVHSSTGKIIMSIILGLGLATLFRAACKGNQCIKRIAPPISELDGKIYKFGNNCFKLEKNHVKCDSKNKPIPFS